MSQVPARKLRTWSGFGRSRRKPTEYEIVTHDANYTNPQEPYIRPGEQSHHAGQHVVPDLPGQFAALS